MTYPAFPAGRRLLVAILAQSGHIAEARRAMGDLLRITPHLTATQLRNIVYSKRLAEFDRWIDALLKAGLK